MKIRVVITVLSLLIVSPLALQAARRTPYPVAPHPGPSLGYVQMPLRDGTDEDTLFYGYGFENGWNGWTTHDFTDVGSMWHTSETHAFSGRSWWCSDPNIGGYNDHWLQYLDTPVLNLHGHANLRLRFMAYWSSENNDTGAAAPPAGYDGWDGSNVWISTNGGNTWRVITPTAPTYRRSSLYSFGVEWGMGQNIPGWTGSSDEANWPAGRWVAAEFNLDQFNVNNVKIRWAFCSDPSWHTGGDGDANRQAWGFQVDSLRVVSGDSVLWSNNGDAQGDMATSSGEGQPSGDFWEITNTGHQSQHSAHCPVRANLSDALVTPALDIPAGGWNTWFDFWFKPDQRAYDPDSNNTLNDFFDVAISTNRADWEQIVWEYDPNGTWHTDWHFFGPDSTFNGNVVPGYPAWKIKLNLTAYAGQQVYLRFRAITDSVMAGDQGTGLYIDDFRLLGNHQAQDDVGLDWVKVSYPTTMGVATSCRTLAVNYGMRDQQQVIKYSRIDAGARSPITPWERLLAGTQTEYPFSITAARWLYADSVNVQAYTQLGADTLHGNDTATAHGVVVYPTNIWRLGYDNRAYTLAFNFARGTGPTIKFTPATDGIRGAFDLKALRVRWNGTQNVDVQTRLHIFSDNRGRMGQELYNAVVNVTTADVLPHVGIIDLTGVQALQRITTDFWVWFEIQRDDNFPQIVGAQQVFGRGHYFSYNGQNADTANAEWQVHAILMPGGFSPQNTLLAGRAELNFDSASVGDDHRMRVALFNGGINPVTVSAAHSDNELFQVDTIQQKTLGIGDMMEVYVTFHPTDQSAVAGRLTFDCTDQTPPTVNMVAYGGHVFVNNDDPTPTEFRLGQAYPNPFNSMSRITYSLAHPSGVRLAVYDLAGRQVAELVNGRVEAGSHSVVFNGAGLATGVYLYRMEAGSFKSIHKLVLVK